MSQYGNSPGGSYGGVPYAPAPNAQQGGVGAWRSPVAVVLVVLGCLLAPVALAGVWFHANIIDVDGYVATITPVADEPAVQNAVADVLAEQVYRALDGSGVLPGIPGELGSITGQLGARQLEDLTRELTLQAVSSSAFRGFWAAANRRVHPILLEAIRNKGDVDLTAGGLVSLDLVEVTRNVTDLLATSGVSLPALLPEVLTTGNVALLDSRPLAKMGSAITALDRLYWLLPIEALVLLLGSVLVATRRLLAALYLGAGLVLAMIALEAGVAVGRAYYLGVTDDAGIPHDASTAMWGVVTSSLRLWGWAVFAVGVAVALLSAAALLVARRGSPPPRQAGAGYPSGPGYAGPTWPPPSR